MNPKNRSGGGGEETKQVRAPITSTFRLFGFHSGLMTPPSVRIGPEALAGSPRAHRWAPLGPPVPGDRSTIPSAARSSSTRFADVVGRPMTSATSRVANSATVCPRSWRAESRSGGSESSATRSTRESPYRGRWRGSPKGRPLTCDVASRLVGTLRAHHNRKTESNAARGNERIWPPPPGGRLRRKTETPRRAG